MKRSKSFLQRRKSRFEALESRRLLASDWRNPTDHLDVNADARVTALDALVIINELNRRSDSVLPDNRNLGQAFFDVDGNQSVTAVDALQVINALNRGTNGYRVVGDTEGFASQRSSLIRLGSDNTNRTFRLQLRGELGQGDLSTSSDLFSVYLVDPEEPTRSLLGGTESLTPIFAYTASKIRTLDGVSRWDGLNLEIDLSRALPTESGNGLLIFQSLNRNGELDTSIEARLVSNSIDGNRTTLRGIEPRSRVVEPAAPTDLPGLTIASDVDLVELRAAYDSTTRTLTSDLAVEAAGQAIGRNVVLLFENLPAGVTIANASGTDSFGSPYISMRDAVESGGLSSNERSNPVRVVANVNSQSSFALEPTILIGTPNSAPQIADISPISVMAGDSYSFAIQASDADQDSLTYSIDAPAGLPSGSVSASGEIRFRPQPTDVGEYTFDLVVSDGGTSARQPVQLSVTPDSTTTTRIRGQILDVDQSPLSGMTIELANQSVLTDSEGRFELDLGIGPLVTDVLRVRGDLFEGVGNYPFIAEKLHLVLGHSANQGSLNTIERPIYLPQLNSGSTIDPMVDMAVEHQLADNEAPVRVDVAAGTLRTQLGTAFTGELSITEVPPNLTPASLPANLLTDLVVTIQPGEMVFTQPAPLSFPNRMGFEPGTEMDLWSISPVTGEFEDVGDMVVSEDGTTIDTVTGGIRNSSWHFAGLAPSDQDDDTKEPECSCEAFASTASLLGLRTGTHLVSHNLPTHDSLGATRGLTLTYDSLRAKPTPTISFTRELVNANPRAGDRVQSSSSLFVSAQISTKGFVRPFGTTASLSSSEAAPLFSTSLAPLADLTGIESFASSLRIGHTLPFEGSQLATGLHAYAVRSGIGRSAGDRVSTTLDESTGAVINVNSINSSFGSGWGLAGLQSLVINNDPDLGEWDGSVLLVDGGGSELAYKKTDSSTLFKSPPNDFSTLVRDSSGGFVRITKEGTESVFNSDGRLIVQRDTNGNATRYEYDDAGNILTVTDPVGLVTTFSYANGRLASITAPGNRVTSMEHDGAGNLIRIIEPDGSSVRYEYDDSRLLTAEVSPNGHVTKSFYDDANRLSRVERPDGTSATFRSKDSQGIITGKSEEFVPEFFYDNSSVMVDESGDTTIYHLDDSGRVASTEDVLGGQGEALRNDQLLPIRQTDSRGNTVNREYDAQGNLIKISEVIRKSATDGRQILQSKFLDGFSAVDSAVADMNGDGSPDLIVATAFSTLGSSFFSQGSIQVLLNDGNGDFRVGDQFDFPNSDAIHPSSISVGDLDNDGDQDIIAYVQRNGGSPLTVLLNNGAGEFVRQVDLPIQGSSRRLISSETKLVDLNNDGFLDIVTSAGGNEQPSELNVYLGADNLRFTSVAGTAVSAYRWEFVDFSGDGLLDLISTADGTILYAPGIGDGTFGQAINLELDGVIDSIVVGDIVGNGQAEIIASVQGAEPTVARISIIDGILVEIQPRTVATIGLYGSLALGDVDGDGDQDLAASGPFGFVDIFNNDGTGQFSLLQTHRSVLGGDQSGTARALATADFNGDGIDDVFAGDDSFLVVFGTDTPRNELARSFPSSAEFSGAVSQDINNDGFDDVLTFDAAGQKFFQYLNDQNGGFGTATEFALTHVPTEWIVTDLNNDSLDDVATLSRTRDEVSVFFALQGGGYSQPVQIPIADQPIEPKLNDEILRSGDFNGDGIQDLVVWTRGEFLNSIFEPPNIRPATATLIPGLINNKFADAVDIALAGDFDQLTDVGDVNGDGLDDLLFNLVDRFRVNFGEILEPFEQSTVIATPGDINQLGVFVSQDDQAVMRVRHRDGDDSPNQRISYYTADGREISLQPDLTPSIGTHDMDGDGNLDFVNFSSNRIEVEFGDGLGNYAETMRFETSNSQPFALGDLNNDGLPDVVTRFGRGENAELRILLNQGGGAEQQLAIQTFTYEPTFNRMTSMTDELGRVTIYEIDPNNGNLLSVTNPSGDVTSYEYDGRGLVTQMTDVLGRITSYGYDGFGRMSTVTYAVGTPDEATMRYEHDEAGNQTAMIDGNGNRTEFQYDLLDRMVTIIEADPDGDGPLTSPITTLAYDDFGNVQSSTDANGQVSTSVFDERERLVRSIGPDPDGSGPLSAPETEYSYDPAGNLDSLSDPNGNTTTYSYDSRDRRLRSTAPDGGVTQFAYDGDGNLTAVTDPVGNLTRFQYDSRDRLITEIDPLGNSIQYSYDTADNLVQKTDRNGRVTKYTYDELDRLKKEEWVGEDEEIVNTIVYDYDAAGNLLTATDAFSALTYTYDARNRVQTVDNAGTPNAPNVILTYVYDDNSNVVTVIDTIEGNAGASTSYQYDGLDRLIVLGQSGNEVTDKRVEFTYNALGQYSAIDRYRDLAGTQLVIGTDYDYDGQNRLTRIDHQNSGGTSVAFYDYEYDVASRITKITDVDGVTDYDYDDRNQLVSAEKSNADFADESYRFDANGNRVESSLHSTGYETGPANRLLSDGGFSYVYDNEGNLIRRTEIATGEYREFEWDYRNRLLSVIGYSSNEDLTSQASYSYDSSNRRLSVNSGGANTLSFIYDRDGVLLEFDDSMIDYTRNLHGDEIDRILIQESDGSAGWLLADHLGSTREIVDGSGGVIQRLHFDSYGNLLTEDARTRYLFAGREFDDAIGLYYARTRYFDQATGRFISEDSIRWFGGQSNLHQYSENDPISNVDPFGTFPVPLIGPALSTAAQIAEFVYPYLAGASDANNVANEIQRMNEMRALEQRAGELLPDAWKYSSNENGFASQLRGRGASLAAKVQRYKNALSELNPEMCFPMNAEMQERLRRSNEMLRGELARMQGELAGIERDILLFEAILQQSL